MNTKKVVSLGALAAGLLLGLTALLPALFPALADVSQPEGQSQATVDEQRAHLWQMQAIMHTAVFSADNQPDGVTVRVTSPDATLAEAIRHEFTEEHALQSPLAGSTVSGAVIEDGVALTFAAQDADVVLALQGYGAGLAYSILRTNMHEAMWSAGAPGAMGPGMMGPGSGPQGRGFGPGTMGPGMMGPGSGPQGRGFGPGTMGPGYGPQGRAGSGYGPGMMGGWGGYGQHGPGMMGGWGNYGPEAQSEGNN